MPLPAEDNPFPYITVDETAAPSSPSAGNQALYIDPSDHHLKRKNSSGTIVDLESVASSSGEVLAADPGSPTDDTSWIVKTGVSPAMNVALKVRIDGVTYTLASITI